MEQEHVGRRVKVAVREREVLGVLADEAHVQLARQLLAGPGQVVGGEVHAEEAGARKRRSEHAQQVPGPAGNVEELQRPAIRRGREALVAGEAHHRRDEPAPHRVRGPAEEQLHLKVVQLGAGVTEVAVGLVVEIPRVIRRVAGTQVRRQLVVAALADPVPRAREIGEQLGSGQGVLPPGQRIDQLARVEALFGVLPILLEELLDAPAERGGRLRLGPAGPPSIERRGIRHVRDAQRRRPGGPAADVEPPGELAAQLLEHGTDLAREWAGRNVEMRPDPDPRPSTSTVDIDVDMGIRDRV